MFGDFCTEDLCIFATATTSHQVEADIDIIPRHVENLAPTLVDEIEGWEDISQLQLDILLNEYTCNPECNSEIETTTESDQVESIFDWNKLYRLSSHKDRAGFVMLILLFIGLPLGLTIFPCLFACKKR